jgi:hypothetical protein
VLIWEQFATQGLDRIPMSAPEFLDYEREIRSCEQVAAFDYTPFNLTAGNVPERVQGAVVSPALFSLLGVEPIAGRTLAREEQGEGSDDVIVISERLWKRSFNSDPFLVGKTLQLNGRNYNVIGVMPHSFDFPVPLFNIQGGRFAEQVDIWEPVAFTTNELKARYARSYGMIGRLRSGVTLATAQAEFDTLTKNWLRAHPDNYVVGFGAKVYQFQEQVVSGMRKGLAILFGAVVFVLLIACANLATIASGAGERARA